MTLNTKTEDDTFRILQRRTSFEDVFAAICQHHVKRLAGITEEDFVVVLKQNGWTENEYFKALNGR